jgi:hypothetical protein
MIIMIMIMIIIIIIPPSATPTLLYRQHSSRSPSSPASSVEKHLSLLSTSSASGGFQGPGRGHLRRPRVRRRTRTSFTSKVRPSVILGGVGIGGGRVGMGVVICMMVAVVFFSSP